MNTSDDDRLEIADEIVALLCEMKNFSEIPSGTHERELMTLVHRYLKIDGEEL